MDVALQPLGNRLTFPDDAVDTALALLALNGGNKAQTVRELQAYGAEYQDDDLARVTRHNLANWTDQYPDRYRYHVTESAQAVEKRLVENQREVASIAASGVRLAVEVEIDRLQSGQVKDASASARNLATVMGIATSKVLELTGRPTTIIEHRRPEDVVNRLSKIIEASAEEIPEDA